MHLHAVLKASELKSFEKKRSDRNLTKTIINTKTQKHTLKMNIYGSQFSLPKYLPCFFF